MVSCHLPSPHRPDLSLVVELGPHDAQAFDNRPCLFSSYRVHFHVDRHVPLNAIEFQRAFARNDPGLKVRSSSDVDPVRYLSWIVPYLYYLDVNVDQCLFGPGSDHLNAAARYHPKTGKIMLVPKGAKQPTVFQRSTPIRNCTYIASAKAFYAAPEVASSRPSGGT